MIRTLYDQGYGLLHQRKTDHLTGLHHFTRKPLHLLNVHGKRPTKVTPHPSCRVVLARNISNSDTTFLRRLAYETSRICSLVTTYVHRGHATSARISKWRQLKLREPTNTCSRQHSSTWQLWKNSAPHERCSRSVVIKNEHQHHFPLWTSTKIVQMLPTLYGKDSAATKSP